MWLWLQDNPSNTCTIGIDDYRWLSFSYCDYYRLQHTILNDYIGGYFIYHHTATSLPNWATANFILLHATSLQNQATTSSCCPALPPTRFQVQTNLVLPFSTGSIFGNIHASLSDFQICFPVCLFMAFFDEDPN